MIKYQSIDSSSEAKSVPGGNRTVKRKCCCFRIYPAELLSFPPAGKDERVLKSRAISFSLIDLLSSFLWGSDCSDSP